VDLSQLRDREISDCHVHLAHASLGPGLLEALDAAGISRLNVVCTPDRQRLSLTPDALYLKAQRPDRIWVFGALDVSALLAPPDEASQRLASCVDTLVAMGCDGVKMIEGKPEIRKRVGVPPFDGDVYAPYWQKLVDADVPVLFHVNDPLEFWDPARIPAWAREHGWFYGGGDFVASETQYAEVLNVLERHPELRVIFAHFFFLAEQAPRLAEILERFPNVCVDLAPGVEMFESFSRAPDAAREFFLRFRDRILFGTDIGAHAVLDGIEGGLVPADCRARVALVRGFLELEREFEPLAEGSVLMGAPDTRFHGIALPDAALDQIYRANFARIAGTQPRPLDAEAIALECERLARLVEFMGAAGGSGPGDASVATLVGDFFSSRGSAD
jgi:predicted TIM-barrel fold metal-dependent hydrolase